MQDTEQNANDKAGDEAMAIEVLGDTDTGTHRRSWSREEKAWIAQESQSVFNSVFQDRRIYSHRRNDIHTTDNILRNKH